MFISYFKRFSFSKFVSDSSVQCCLGTALQTSLHFCLVTVLLYQCMNIITKKMTTHPFVILFLRDCLLLPQVKKII